MNKIDEKVKKLLEYDLQPTMRGGWKITEEMCVLIHEIAEECNKLEVTQKINMDIPEWLEEADPEEIFIYMLQKMVSEQTRIHMLCVPRILLPIIDRKLNSENDRFPHVVGQGAEIYYNGEWKRGKIVEGYRFKDGVVTIETPEGERIWCGEDRKALYRPGKGYTGLLRKMDRDLIIDCFAGGGGASVGIEMALGRPVDIAINHDHDAILMHKTNHPDTLHLTEDIFKVDLKRYVKGRHIALMWASPDCTSHSKAKGGKPREKGLRILLWAVYKHAKTILPDVILMENVEEIQQWGPLDSNGYPIKERRGEDYRKFIMAMKSLGYMFECKELVAADYGAPTTRKRWYAIFRRDGRDIVWPEPTYFKDKDPRWKACGNYIDWSDLGRSIFNRPKPLAEATMKRIANGIRKYIVENPSPYIVRDKRAVAFMIQYHGETKEGDSRGQLLTEPIRTIDTSNRYGLATAFITKFYKSGIGQSCEEPLHTITTSPGHFGLISAFLIKYYGTGGGQELTEPLATITAKDRFGLVNVLIEIDGAQYILKDIFMRMLKPEELKLMQGFPKDYIIDRDYRWKPYPIAKQVARIGNSVVPIMAQKLVEVNCRYLKVGERVPNMRIDDSKWQLRFV